MVKDALTLPNLLLVGAQKCATSTLSADLGMHPQVYIPQCKEVGGLLSESVVTDRGRRRYANYYGSAKSLPVRGDMSTAYTKLPVRTNIPVRAKYVLGPKIKIIYIVRDPFERLVSQYKHEFAASESIPKTLERALLECPELINYSRYAMQLEAWLKEFPAASIRVVHFETYVKDRLATLNVLFQFLGVDPIFGIVPQEIVNEAASRRSINRFVKKILLSHLYKSILRRSLPDSMRLRLKSLLSSPAQIPVCLHLEEVRERVIKELRVDQSRFAAILGLDTIAWHSGAWGNCGVAIPRVPR